MFRSIKQKNAKIYHKTVKASIVDQKKYLEIRAWTGETLSYGFANNKGTDQPVLPHCLSSPFVIRLLGSIIS